MGNSASEVTRAKRVATEVLERSGTPLLRGLTTPVSAERHIIWRADVQGPTGPEVRAVRVKQAGVDVASFQREQRISDQIARAGADVVAPFGPTPVQTGEDDIGGVWEWHPFGVPGETLNMRTWGEKLARFYEVCAEAGLLNGAEAGDTTQQFSIAFMRKRIAETPGHPLQGRPGVVDLLERRLAESAAAVREASQGQPLYYLLGDNHRLNCGGDPFKFSDLEYAGPGILEDELAITQLGADRYEGWTQQHLLDLLDGMGNPTTPDRIKPYSRNRGLVWNGWVLAYANEPEQRSVVEERIAWIDEPSDDLPRWTHVGNPALMDARGLIVTPTPELGTGGLGPSQGITP